MVVIRSYFGFDQQGPFAAEFTVGEGELMTHDVPLEYGSGWES